MGLKSETLLANNAQNMQINSRVAKACVIGKVGIYTQHHHLPAGPTIVLSACFWAY